MSDLKHCKKIFFKTKWKAVWRQIIPLFDHVDPDGPICFEGYLSLNYYGNHIPLTNKKVRYSLYSFVYDYTKIELVYVTHEIYIQNKEKFDMNNPVHCSKILNCFALEKF